MHNIDDILAKHFSGLKLANEEEKLLSKWRLDNPEEFEALKSTMTLKQEASYKTFDTNMGWGKMSERIDSSSKTRVFTLKPILKLAAVASIAILLGVVGFQFFGGFSSNMIVFENNTPGADSLTLPDGSQVFLAQNSKLEYVEYFTEKRHLKLEGEAFFEVEKNKEKPFTIDTEYGLVKVLGTSFNVNTNNKTTQVDVRTGLVSLSFKDSEIKLAKNESAWSNGKTISRKADVNPNYLSWRTGDFQFDSTPFEDVIKFLESFYGDVIDVETDTKEKCTFTGTFSDQNIDGIIEALVLSCNLEFSKENNRIILK